MYVPDILTVPLTRTDELTSEHPLLDDGQVQIGIWECRQGLLHDETGGDFDEVMFMVAGRATVRRSDGDLDLAPGTLWTTPRRWGSEWAVHQTVRKLYVIDHRPGEPGVAGHLPNAFTAVLGESIRRPVVLDGDPHESSATLWAHNRLEAGVWECTPGEFPFRRDGYDEVFCVLGGHATIHVDGKEGPGQTFELRPGSVMLTPNGLTGRWVVHETIRKAYAIVHR
ncbi:MAG: cupin domain-containing protein [Ilumatobacteraceae bacterium]